MHPTKLHAEHEISGQGSHTSVPLKLIRYHPFTSSQLLTTQIEKVSLGTLWLCVVAHCPIAH